MNDRNQKTLVRLIKIIGLVLLLGVVIASLVGGTEVAVYIYLWAFIGVQVLTVIRGVAVFWANYSCSLTNKIVFAAFAIISAAIYVKIGFYLLDLLKSETFDALTIFVTTTLLAFIDISLSLAAKRFILKIPFPWFYDPSSRSSENDGFQS